MQLQINKDQTLQFLLLKVGVTICTLYASAVAVCMEHSGICNSQVCKSYLNSFCCQEVRKVLIGQIKQTLHSFKARAMSKIKELSLGKTGDKLLERKVQLSL